MLNCKMAKNMTLKFTKVKTKKRNIFRKLKTNLDRKNSYFSGINATNSIKIKQKKGIKINIRMIIGGKILRIDFLN